MQNSLLSSSIQSGPCLLNKTCKWWDHVTDLRSCDKVAHYKLKCLLSNTACCFTHKTRYTVIVSLCIIMYIALSIDNVLFFYLFFLTDLTIKPLLIQQSAISGRAHFSCSKACSCIPVSTIHRSSLRRIINIIT